MQINILFIDKSKVFSGAEISLVNLIKHLDNNSFKAIINFNYPMDHQSGYLRNKIEAIFRNKKLRWWMGSDFSLKAPRGTDFIKRIIFAIQLAYIIRKRKINTCHINLLRETDWTDIIFAKLAGSRIIGHVRSLQYQSKLSKSILQLCDRIICTSDYVLKEISEILKSDSVLRIYDPVDPADYDVTAVDQANTKAKYSIQDSTVVLSSVAMLDPRKGHDTAIRALKEISNDLNVVLIIAGGSVAKNNEIVKLKNLVNVLNLNNRVFFTGHIDSIKEIYAISDMILSLSKDGEAFGRVPLEAALAKKVVITTNLGAVPEIVIDNQTGFLIDPDNPEKLASVILHLLLSGKEHMKDIQENAYHRAISAFSPELHTSAVEAVYRSL